MVKVMVVIYGLVLLVPGGGEEDMLTAVFLETGHLAPGMQHEPRVQQMLKGEHPENSWSLPDYFVMELGSSSEAEESLNDALDRFVQLSGLSKEPVLKVRPECATGSRQECENGSGKPLVRGVLRVKSPWRARAASYCGKWVTPICFRDDGGFQYRKGERVEPKDPKVFSLATALVLEGEVPVNALGKLLMLGESQEALTARPLQKAQSEVCGAWFLDRKITDCAILLAGNQTDPPPGPHGGHKLDRHFGAFYALTTPKPESEDYLFPYLHTWGDACNDPEACNVEISINQPENDPSPRCPPPVGYPATEARAEAER